MPRNGTVPRPSSECISVEELRSLVRYDAQSGSLHWLVNRSRKAKRGMKAGCVNRRGAITLCIKQKSYLAHQIAWALHHGEWAECEIDHIDGNPSNNRACNLRRVTREGNIQNLRKATSRNRSSGLLGARKVFNRSSWTAEIRADGRRIYLGCFRTKEEAHAAYLAAKRRLHSTCSI